MNRLALAAALTVAAGCTPMVITAGPAIDEPTLTGEGFMAADGALLPMHSWMPEEGEPRAVIVAVHGFNDYGNFFNDAAAFLAARGIASYSYDQRGFGAAPRPGLWHGTAAMVADLGTVVELVARRHPDLPLFLLGASMGGAVIMVAMTGAEAPAVDGVILAAPAVWGRVTMPWYQRLALWLGAHIVPGLELTGRGLEIRASDNDEMLLALGRDPLIIKETRVDALHGVTDLMDAALEAAASFDAPALILYGDHDQVVPERPTYLMFERLPEAAVEKQRIAIYEKGFHMLLRDLQAETVWTDVAAWINDARAPLPSGAEERAREVLGNLRRSGDGGA